MLTAHGCKAVFLRSCRVSAGAFVFLFTVASPLAADDATPSAQPASTLSQQIDELLQPPLPQMVAARDTDGALLRRLSLDVRGVVPTREELDAFAADDSADRWPNWVDKFLQDPLCDEHLCNFLDRTLMLRRSYSQVDRAAWILYLRDHVAAGTPLDVLSRELLFQPWWNREQRPAQRFYLDRAGDPHLITRDLARVFLGRDLQCAQCHDHPHVDDFRQVDYHGLLAFVSAGILAEVTYKDAEEKDQKIQLYVEKAAGDAPFESVFERGTTLRSGTRLMGQAEHFDLYQPPDQRYLDQAPEGALAGAALPPKVSRREELARRLADRGNAAFVANWANRLWALVYGRGLVHPVDMTEPDNPPTHPELFRLISDGLLQADMRIKPFLRQLVMTEAYQRGGSSEVLQLAHAPSDSAVAEMREQLENEMAIASAKIESLSAKEKADLETYEASRAAWLKVQADRTTVRSELDTAEAAMLGVKKKHEEAGAALAAAQKKLVDSQTRATLLDESATKLEQALALAGGEDAELSQAIGVAKQRAEAARGQTPELEKGVTDTQTAVTAAMTALQQSTTLLNEIVEKLKPIQAALLAADEASVAARDKWANAHSTTVAVKRSLSRAKHLADWLDELAKADRLTKSIQGIDGQVAVAEVDAAKMLNSIATAKTTRATAAQVLQSANQQFAQAKQDLEQHQQLISSLEQALSSIGEAAKLVSKADTLVAAQNTLREEIAAKQMLLGQLQSAADVASANVAANTEALAKQDSELESQLTRHKEHLQQLASLQTQREQQRRQLEATQVNINTQAQSISSDSEAQLASVGLVPLTAEQMCWSTLRVTGVLDAYIRTEIAELEKQSPLPADADDANRARRQQQAVRQAIEKLRGIADHYVSLYASGPDKTQDDYFASADQALYVANGGSVFGWAGPGNNNPTQVATSLTDPAEVARVLYWSYLCRQPSPEETAMVSEQLASAGDQRNAIIQEMAWSLLASAEFRFTR